MSELINKYLQAFSNPFLITGIVGQLLFFSRFVVQWIASEKKKDSVIPTSFWYLSIFGSLLILVYAISVADLIFTAGSSLNLIIYFRNLHLIKKKKRFSN